MAPLASLMVLSFALQCIDPAGSETQCTATVDKEVCAWPFDYWQQSDAVRRSRTDTMITVSFTINTDGPSNECGYLQLEGLEVFFDGQSRLYNSYGNITELTEDWKGTRHTVSFKLNAEDVVKHMESRVEDNNFLLVYQPKYSKNSSKAHTVWCFINRFYPKILLRYDNSSSIRIERVEKSSDQLSNSSMPSSVLRNGTQVPVWKENPLGFLTFKVNVSDDNVYKQNQYQFEYSAITRLNETFSVLVQFCNTLDSHQQETVADADALSVERPLGTRSASCQQLAWCAQVNLLNSSEDPNRALMQYRWNVTELYSAVQELYEQLDLSNRSFALVFVTMEVSATSGTANPLHSSKQVVWAVWLPQRLRATVVGKSSEKEYEITTSAAKTNVKAEMPTFIMVVLCVLRAVYEQ